MSSLWMSRHHLYGEWIQHVLQSNGPFLTCPEQTQWCNLNFIFWIDSTKNVIFDSAEARLNHTRTPTVMAFSITIFSIMTLSIKDLFVTLRINVTQHDKALPLFLVSLCCVSHSIYCYSDCHYDECHYDECHYTECQ